MGKVTFRELVRVRRLPWVSSVDRVMPPAGSVTVTSQRWWGRAPTEPVRRLFGEVVLSGRCSRPFGLGGSLLQNLLHYWNAVKFTLQPQSFRGIVSSQTHWSRLNLRPAGWEPMLCQPFGTHAWPSHHSVRTYPARAKKAHSRVASPPRFLGPVARKRDWLVLSLTTVFSSPSPLRRRWARRLA